MKCKHCGSSNVESFCFRRRPVRFFPKVVCLDCHKTSILFKRIFLSDALKAKALSLRAGGLSFKGIEDYFGSKGFEVSRSTISEWYKREVV